MEVLGRGGSIQPVKTRWEGCLFAGSPSEPRSASNRQAPSRGPLLRSYFKAVTRETDSPEERNCYLNEHDTLPSETVKVQIQLCFLNRNLGAATAVQISQNLPLVAWI